MNLENNLKNFSKLKKIGDLTAQCLNELDDVIHPGISTYDIEQYVIDFQKKYNLQNSQYGYKGFPAHCCVSRNDVLCHGIPTKDQYLYDGDIVSVDVTFNLDGWHGDSCRTFEIGAVTTSSKHLISVAKYALIAGIKSVKIGNFISDITDSVSEYVKKERLYIAQDFTGHGIGQRMHESELLVPHSPLSDDIPDLQMKAGMVFTIEPIITEKKTDSVIMDDQWTVVTKNGSWTAQFEVTIGITEDEIVILTPIKEISDVN